MAYSLWRMRIFGWRRRRVICFVLAAVCLVVLGLFGYTVEETLKHNQCSETEARTMLSAVCKLYNNSEVAGSLCHDLCVSKDIRYDECTNYRGGKKVVFATWISHAEKIVLKSKHTFITEYDEVGYKTPDGVYDYPNIEMFLHIVRDSLLFNYGIKVETSEDILTRMWSMNFTQFISRSAQDVVQLRAAAMRSLWSLMDQDEYSFMKFYQHIKYIPKILGTCGHVYAMDMNPPGELMKIRFFYQKIQPWAIRAKLALKLLDLVYNLQHNFHEPLHLCDVKENNFGMNEKDGMMKLIDVDMALFESHMLHMLGNENCTTNSDCHFFDCYGICHMISGKCMRQRSNNNLQSLCEDIFVSKLRGLVKGLLREPPPSISVKLNTYLQECVNPMGGNPDDPEVRYAASNDIYWKIYSLLQSTINTS